MKNFEVRVIVTEEKRFLTATKRMEKRTQKTNTHFSTTRGTPYKVTHKIDDKEYTTEYVKYTIMTDELKFDDWQLAGTIDCREGGNILRTNMEVPESYRTVSHKCDYCTTKRIRKDTFIVKNAVSGEFKQIGRNCLGLFLGVNVEFLLNLFDFIRSEDTDESEENTRYYGVQTYYLNEFVNACARLVIKEGFKSSQFNGATASSANYMIYTRPTTAMRKETLEAFRTNYPETEESKKLANDVIEYTKALTGDTNYINNLRILYNSENIQSKDFGYVASAFSGYLKAKEIEFKRINEAKAYSNKWAGEISERKNFEVEVVNCHTTDTKFGKCYIYTMKDNNKNRITWFTNDSKMEVGSKYKVKATIKKLDVYNGLKQTVITRGKVTNL